MKARAEARLHRQGPRDRELKRGRGGIRDIEFAVQLLQLVHGRHDESIRSATTLDALEQLGGGGYVESPDAGRLDEAYVFLRTVEHRLQLGDEQQTHTLPTDAAARDAPRPRARVTATARTGPPSSASTRTIARTRARSGRSTRSSSSRRCSTRSRASAALTAGGRGGATRRVRVPRRAPDAAPRCASSRAGFDRTSRRDAAAAPGASSTGSRERPIPISGCCSCAGSPRAPTRAANARATLPRLARCRRARVPHPRVEPRARRRAAAANPTSSTSSATTPSSFASEPAASSSTTRSRPSTGARTSNERRAGLRRFKRRELLRIARARRARLRATEVDRARARRARRRVRRGRAALARADGAVRGHRPGPARWRELSYASDIDVMFVYDGDSPADFDDRGARRDRSSSPRSARRTREGRTFRDRRRACAPRASRARSPARSTDTARTTSSTG